MAAAQQHRYVYDAAGRQTKDQLYSLNVKKWETTTAYGGDHTDVTPPAGGTATTTFTDIKGHTTLLEQYTAAGTPTGAHQDTSYTYDRLGQLTAMTDPEGNTWTNTYDRQARPVSTVDPDRGTITNTYDVVGNVTSVTDGRNQKVSTKYDELNRRMGLALTP